MAVSDQGEPVDAKRSTMNIVMMGEIHTGLLHHSSAVSQAMATRLLDLVLGERVRRSDRPAPYVLSPARLTGVDCLLPVTGGAKVRGVGTVVSRAAIKGGHILQGSAFVQIRRSPDTRRLPWSHYLARPGVVETLGKAKGGQVAEQFLTAASTPGCLDLGAIGRRAMDAVQDHADLDHRTAFRSTRTGVRWVVAPDGENQTPVVFGVMSDTARTLTLPNLGLDVMSVAEFCEDLAMHDWLLTTLLSLIERSRIGSGSRSETVRRLRPAVDFLLHLWMPAARAHKALDSVWQGMEHRPGFSRQWQINVDRIRDQLALGTMESLLAAAHGL